MVVNFRVREISKGVCKLVRTSTLIIIKKIIPPTKFLPLSKFDYMINDCVSCCPSLIFNLEIM
jgi:hypothetical protein